MSSSNAKIGTILSDGEIEWPTKTLDGRPYTRDEYKPAAPPAIHNLPGGHFAVGSSSYPRDFNVEAALDELRAELTPASMPSRKVKAVDEP